ncbi:hypothetical protein F5Y04DRAFT_288477 [Hypomontagnella monticulosa]|nr:hypothetical protein F5Y04DRAFT_288477 [Hypomontagnella monticulosa]
MSARLHGHMQAIQPITGSLAQPTAPIGDQVEAGGRSDESTTPAIGHGKVGNHDSYCCACGKSYTRVDALRRHIKSQSNATPLYPCGYCYEHQGEKGFRRIDNLIQHLEGYHKIKNPEKLNKLRAEAAARATAGVSDTPAPCLPQFPCPSPGCDKVGMNGFCRQAHLDEHWSWMHAPLDMLFPNSDAMQLDQLNGGSDPML